MTRHLSCWRSLPYCYFLNIIMPCIPHILFSSVQEGQQVHCKYKPRKAEAKVKELVKYEPVRIAYMLPVKLAHVRPVLRMQFIIVVEGLAARVRRRWRTLAALVAAGSQIPLLLRCCCWLLEHVVFDVVPPVEYFVAVCGAAWLLVVRYEVVRVIMAPLITVIL